MKRSILRHRFALWAIAALTFASCSQDELANKEMPLSEGQYPLEINAAGMGAVAVPAATSTRGTMDGNWDGVSSVAVQVGGKVKEYSVIPLENNATAQLTPAAALTPNDADRPFWWTSSAETKSVTGWYPYSEELPSEWSLETDQSYGFPAEKDFLYAFPTNIAFSARNEASLEFRHTLSKMTINIMNSKYLTDYGGKLMIELRGFPVSGYFYPNNKDNEFRWNYRQGIDHLSPHITPHQLETTGTEYYATYEAVFIPPQKNIPKNPFFAITVGNTIYKWTMELSSYDLKGGYEYTFNITVKPTGLEVKVADEGIAWGTGGASGSGSVTLP